MNEGLVRVISTLDMTLLYVFRWILSTRSFSPIGGSIRGRGSNIFCGGSRVRAV